MRKYIDLELSLLRQITPDFSGQIYSEIRRESNTYGMDGEYERIMRANWLLLRGVPPSFVLECIKQQKDGLLEMVIKAGLYDKNKLTESE